MATWVGNSFHLESVAEAIGEMQSAFQSKPHQQLKVKGVSSQDLKVSCQHSGLQRCRKMMFTLLTKPNNLYKPRASKKGSLPAS